MYKSVVGERAATWGGDVGRDVACDAVTLDISC